MGLMKVNSSMLEMVEVANMLRTVKKFITADDSATDTKSVGGTVSEHIAQAYVTEKDKDGNDVVADRSTVRNSMNLGEHPVDYFMTTEHGKNLEAKTDKARSYANSELSELRDELYQLKAELAKSGIVKDYSPYAGFYDLFRDTQPVHENQAVAVATEESSTQYMISIHDNVFDQFAVGERIMLKNLEDGMTSVVTISELGEDHQTLHFKSAAGFAINKDQCEIYKSKGNNINGEYCFGEVSSIKPGQKEFYTGVDDDSYRSRRRILAGNSGFAYNFRIPAMRQKNYLKGFDIAVKKYGTPGALMCYIIDATDTNKWKNAAKAITDGIVIATSQPLNVDARLGEHIESFSFLQNDRLPYLEQEDTTDKKVRYVAVIEALSADAQNCYELTFCQSKDVNGNLEDLQLNNTTYFYKAVEDESAVCGLTTDSDINSMDLYYGVSLSEAVQQVYTPYENGLYAARFKSAAPVPASHARLSMKIAREGIFNVDATGSSSLGALTDGSAIIVKGATVDDVKGFRKEQYVVVGTNLRQLQNVTESSLTFYKGMYVEANDPVYPMGYQVFIKCKNTAIENDTNKKVVMDSGRFPMNLVAIIPEKNGNTSEDSARLIFEADFTDANGSPITFNDFELSIYWDSSCSGDITERLTGKIKALNLNVERAL